MKPAIYINTFRLLCCSFYDDEYAGMGLELGAIVDSLNSALEPCGITNLQARQFAIFVDSNTKVKAHQSK